MAGLSYSGLVTQIRNYTETDSNVLTTDILENIILNSQYRIMRDIPIDADRVQQTGNLVIGQETINSPGGSLFIRGIQVYDSNSAVTAAGGTFQFANPADFDGISGSNIAKSAGYAITTGIYKSGARISTDYAVANFFFFTVDTNTATIGGVKGGGIGCSVGPVTLSA